MLSILNSPQLLQKRDQIKIFLQKIDERENDVLKDLKEKLEIDLSFKKNQLVRSGTKLGIVFGGSMALGNSKNSLFHNSPAGSLTQRLNTIEQNGRVANNQIMKSNPFVDDIHVNEKASIAKNQLSKRMQSLKDLRTQLSTILHTKEQKLNETDFQKLSQEALLIDPDLQQALKDERVQLKVYKKSLIEKQSKQIYKYELEKIERERLLCVMERKREQKLYDDVKIHEITAEIEMNDELMQGFENANFILKSRSDYTEMFVDESKKTIERIRQN
eukprot:403358048